MRLIPCLFVVAALAWAVPPGARAELRVGYLPILDHLTLVVAQARERPTADGVDVRARQFRSWDSMAGALRAGKLDAAFILAPLALQLHETGADIRVVMLAHRNGSALIVRRDSGIDSAAGLAGKVLAIPHRHSTHTALLDTYLRQGQLTLADVRTRKIAPSNMVTAMALGKIDGYIVAEPFGVRGVTGGVGKVLILSKDIVERHIDCVVVVREEFIREQGAALQAWLDGLLRAARHIEHDRSDNAAREVAAIVHASMGHPEAVTREALLQPSDRILFTDLQPRAADLRRIADIAVRAELIVPMDIEGIINAEFYRSSAEKD